MTNYIPDFSKTHWMASNPARTTRTGMDGKPFRCPFCYGNEADTPPEVFRIGEGEKDKLGWKIRVVPNKFNITEIHEVIIHSPDHNKNVEELELIQIENIIKTYINRFNALKEKGKVFIFSNQSLVSGASLIHSHSQVSVVPNDIPTNTLPAQPVVNIVEQIGEFISYCPEYSEWGFETWIKENKTNVILGRSETTTPESDSGQARMTDRFENLNEKQIQDLAKILLSTILKLKKIHANNSHYSKKPFGYNFYFSIPQEEKTGSPIRSGMTQDTNTKDNNIVIPVKTGIQDSGNNWYLRIIPRFMERAGFELSTGIIVNSVEAKRASEELRNL